MEDSVIQSGALIGSNEDLLTEILVRLPATSILRFKSVSKHWQSLLSDPSFTKRYDNYFSKFPGLLAGNIYVPYDVENPSPSPFRDLDFYFNRSNVRIRQSCNGLLLCSTVYNGACEYYVFNPNTKQLAIIPLVPKSVRFMALAFHQTHCVHYKVVCICALEPDENMYQIQIYSTETRKWNTCIESFSAPKPVFHDPVYWNGAVYWPPFYSNRNYFYFKIEVGQLQTLPLPEGLVFDDKLMYFGESRGHLHLILHKEHGANALILNVYEMLMDHSGWFVKYRVQLDDLPATFPDMFPRCGYNFYVVDVVRGKEEEDTFLVLLTSGKMIRYNVRTNSFKELYSKKYCFALVSSFHRYIEALSSF